MSLKYKVEIVTLCHTLKIVTFWLSRGGEDLLSVAYRKVREDVGLNVNFFSLKPILIFSNSVNQHVENGMYIPAHIHFDTLYYFDKKLGDYHPKKILKVNKNEYLEDVLIKSCIINKR